MKYFLKSTLAVVFLGSTSGTWASDDSIELTNMLNTFLACASVNDVAAHDRFWAEDLIYTSSSGERIGKADIMNGLNTPAPANEGEAAAAPTVYTAEDIRIQQYGDTAIVAFKLVGTTQAAAGNTSASPEILYYYNTGTFLRRDGQWRVVAWQATRIPAAP
jgi:ketosteroid isomerase-like protein